MKTQNLNKPKPTSGVLRHNIIGHSVDQENVQVTIHQFWATWSHSLVGFHAVGVKGCEPQNPGVHKWETDWQNPRAPGSTWFCGTWDEHCKTWVLLYVVTPLGGARSQASGPKSNVLCLWVWHGVYLKVSPISEEPKITCDSPSTVQY